MRNLDFKRLIYGLILLGIIVVCLYPPMEVLYQFSGKGPSEFIQHRFLFADATWEEGADEYRATVAVGRLFAYIVVISCTGLLARLGLR